MVFNSSLILCIIHIISILLYNVCTNNYYYRRTQKSDINCNATNKQIDEKNILLLTERLLR